MVGSINIFIPNKIGIIFLLNKKYYNMIKKTNKSIISNFEKVIFKGF